MKTAIELAARLSARYLDTKQMLPDELAHESAAMILQQAEQIEALTKERDGAYVQSLQFSEENEALLKANLDCVDHFNTLKTDYDALKADAERYQWLRKHVVFGYCSPEGCNSDDVYLTITGYKAFPQTGKTVDAAIDAMKGKS